MESYEGYMGFNIIVLLSLLVFVSGLHAQQDPPPVEAYASLPFLEQVSLSPDGDRLVVLLNTDGLAYVSTLELGASQKMVPVLFTDNEKFKINWTRWANNERLLVSLRFPASRQGADTTETRLMSIKNGETEMKNLVGLRKGSNNPQFQDRVIDYLPDDDGHVLMSLDIAKPNAYGIYKVNVATGKRKRVERGRKNVIGWITDRQHRIRLMMTLNNGAVEIKEREPDASKWRVLWSYDYFSADMVEPMGFDRNPDILYVKAYHNDKLAIFKLNLQDPKLNKELVFFDPDYDVEGALIYSLKKQMVVGIRNNRRQNGYVFWDKELAALANGIASGLPDTSNYLLGTSADEMRYILFSESDVQPGKYYFGDRKTKQLTPFAERYPKLKTVKLAKKQPLRYPASDGELIEAYLTLPENTGIREMLPTIIFPHGGPISRTTDGFDYWTAFFSSRGYAVLQMNFRGSSGSGFEFMAAGMQNWDKTIVADINDGTRFMIEEGISDPDRICIVGASFGGYAALMGMVTAKDMYQCAISFAGVADLVQLRNHSRRYLHSELVEKNIGSERKKLKAASPISHVEMMGDPILLIHGAKDRVVEVDHSRDMYDDMKSAGKKVEYHELPTGDHHLSNHFDRIKTFELMEKFLATHLHR